jgi:hypothetical protein
LHFLVSRSIKVKYHIGTKKNTKQKKEFRHNISHLFTDVIITMSVTHRVFKAFLTIFVGGKEAAMAAEEEMSNALSQTTLPHPGKHARSTNSTGVRRTVTRTFSL